MGWSDLLAGVSALVWVGCASYGVVIKMMLAERPGMRMTRTNVLRVLVLEGLKTA